MKTQDFKVAGWVAVLAVTVFAAEISVTILSEIPAYAGVFTPSWVALLLAIHVILASYAMYCLRAYLNEKYDFHGVDLLIPLLVVGGILFAVVLIGTRLYADATISIIAQLGVGLPLGVVSILVGYRLLGVNGTIGGYKKPFAYAHMIAPVCFLSIVLAPVGLLLSVAGEILLALIFFSDENVELEFV